MSVSLLLNRTTAPMTIRFMDLCFKRGVLDACDYGDDLGVKEFLDKHSADWSFGIIGKDDDMDWEAFRYELYWLARKKNLKSFAEGYLFRIRQKNFSWCVLLFCMRFYLLGVSEWLKYPSPVRIEMFKSRPRIHWDPAFGTRYITRADIISYLHQFEYEYRKADESVKSVSDSLMGNFIQALYDLSRRYVTGTTKEEDI